MKDDHLIERLHGKGIYLPAPNTKPVQNDITGRIRELEDDWYGYAFGYHFFVEKGFRFDGASKPQIVWSLVGSPHVGYDSRPCFLHDVLYGCKGKGKHLSIEVFKQFEARDKFFTFANAEFERSEADELWLDLMKEFTVCWAKRNLMHGAVRTFGNKAWNDDTQIDIEHDRRLITICKEME